MSNRYRPIHERSDDDIIKIVSEDFEASEWARREKNDQNMMAYRAFHCRDLISVSSESPRNNGVEDLIGPGVSHSELESIGVNKTYVPWLRGIILTSCARLAVGLWPDFNDFFRIDPATQDDEKAARSAQGLLMTLVRESKYRTEAILALLQAHYFDFSILYTGWKTERHFAPRPVDTEVMIKNFETGEWTPTGKVDHDRREFAWTQEEVSGWDVGAINTMNFRVDPEASHDGFGEFCGITCLIPKRQMWDMAELGEWDKTAVAMIDPDETPEDAGADEGVQDMAARLKEDEKLQGFNFDSYIEKRYVRADMYWSPTSKVVLLNRKAVALKEKSFRIPFHKSVFIQNVGMFSGTSLAEKLLPVQFDINQCLRLLRTQQDRQANLDSVIDQSWFGSSAEVEAQPWGTGARIVLPRNPQGRDPAAVMRYIDYPAGRLGDVWNSITLQTGMGERSVGISAQSQGDVAEGGATATAVRDASAGVSVRAKMIDIWVEASLVIQPLADLIKLASLNMRMDRKVRLRGAEGKLWENISPQNLLFAQPPDVVPLGMSSMASRAVASQALRDVTLAFASNPFWQQYLMPLKNMREIYKSMDIDPDTMVANQGMADQVNVPPAWVPGLLADGKRVPINPWDDHAAVLEAITEFTRSAEFEQVSDESKILILEHVRQRQAAMQQGNAGGGGKMAPSLPNEAGGGGQGGGQQVIQPMVPPSPGAAATPPGQPAGPQSQPMQMQPQPAPAGP